MTSLRILEVGALPFPTHQGTQALIREQCEALARRGHDVHLLVYAHGAYPYEPPGYVVHRLGDWPRERSLRSGPSWRKVALDLALARETRRLSRHLRPHLVHAHNYEGLVAALLARPRAPIVYHAHTLFGHELPTFMSSSMAENAARMLGDAMDRQLPRRADLTLAVSPRLVAELVALGHPPDRLECSLPGIEIPEHRDDPATPRRQLALEDKQVLCYCGNLDGYQDWRRLIDVMALLAPKRPALHLLVITASEGSPVERAMGRQGLADRLTVRKHGAFSDVLEQLYAADVCLVPRSAPGGVPIKLLVYLAAGRPVVASSSGTAGIDFADTISIVPDGDPEALARCVEGLLDDPVEARSRAERGRRLVRDEFGWDRRCASLERQLFKVLD